MELEFCHGYHSEQDYTSGCSWVKYKLCDLNSIKIAANTWKRNRKQEAVGGKFSLLGQKYFYLEVSQSPGDRGTKDGLRGSCFLLR